MTAMQKFQNRLSEEYQASGKMPTMALCGSEFLAQIIFELESFVQLSYSIKVETLSELTNIRIQGIQIFESKSMHVSSIYFGNNYEQN